VQPSDGKNKAMQAELRAMLARGTANEKSTGFSIGQPGLIDFDDIGDDKKGKKKGKEVGALMMRGAAKDAKDHGAQGVLDVNSMSPEDRELHSICEMIGQKAAMKYRTVREALRFVDADRDGFIQRSEIEYFFRAYDVSSEKVADHLFDRLDRKGIGELEYASFVEFLGPYIRGDPPNALAAADAGSEASTRQATPAEGAQRQSGVQFAPGFDPRSTAGNTPPVRQALQPSQAAYAQKNNEWSVDQWMNFLGRKSSERFAHVMDLIRHIDRDYDGNISRDEMRHFFSIFGLDAKVSDTCWTSMRRPGEPEVEYMDFMRAIAPHLDLPGVKGVLHQGGGMGGKRIPVKQRMGRAESLTAGYGEDKASEEQKAKLQARQEIRNLRSMMQDIGVKLQLKFRHAREAFRGLDLDKDGSIAPNELRAFLLMVSLLCWMWRALEK
jgi:Ca2+-binding EF-hand superfamily protein